MNKRFSVMFGVGSSKYLVNFHDGEKKHGDGSDFFDVRIFKSQKKLEAFTQFLRDGGYREV